MKFKGIIYYYESPSGKFYIGQTTWKYKKDYEQHIPCNRSAGAI